MPGLLPASELASIQAFAVAAACDLVATIQRKAITPDGVGQDSFVWSTIATTVAGMTQPTAGQLQNYDFLIGSLSAWQVHLPIGTSVAHQDHILIGTHTLEVQVVLQPRSYSALLIVLASEVQ